MHACCIFSFPDNSPKPVAHRATSTPRGCCCPSRRSAAASSSLTSSAWGSGCRSWTLWPPNGCVAGVRARVRVLSVQYFFCSFKWFLCIVYFFQLCSRFPPFFLYGVCFSQIIKTTLVYSAINTIHLHGDFPPESLFIMWVAISLWTGIIMLCFEFICMCSCSFPTP